MIDKEEGLKHIHNVMHVFIEGIAAGIYENVDDVQGDAREYLAMERAVEKLGDWKEGDSVDDLAKIFEGVSNSLDIRRAKVQEEKEWQQVQAMPKLGENDVK